MLEGLKEIARFLEVSPKRVRSFARRGAPIRVVGEGIGARYLAESDALLAWVRGDNGQPRPASAS